MQLRDDDLLRRFDTRSRFKVHCEDRVRPGRGGVVHVLSHRAVRLSFEQHVQGLLLVADVSEMQSLD